MPKLDIIVTHYDETYTTIRGFFNMLSIQRGVNFDDINLIIVQDGKNDYPWFEWLNMFPVYFYDRIKLYTIEHSGVSTARNTGLSRATSDWVMFCDCDDMLYSADSLYRILTSIDQAGDRADMLWSPFWIEYAGKSWHKVLKEWNTVFIHGKIYRREFLTANQITFDPSISYAEDALFNAEVAMCINPGRIARIPETIYMWCYRENSLTTTPERQAQRNLDLYSMRLKRSELYDKHGMHYEAETSAVRTIMDYYWELNGSDNPPDGGTAQEWHDRVQHVFDLYPDCCDNITTIDWNKLCQVTESEARAKRFYRDNIPSIDDWILQFRNGGEHNA